MPGTAGDGWMRYTWIGADRRAASPPFPHVGAAVLRLAVTRAAAKRLSVCLLHVSAALFTRIPALSLSAVFLPFWTEGILCRLCSFLDSHHPEKLVCGVRNGGDVVFLKPPRIHVFSLALSLNYTSEIRLLRASGRHFIAF